MILNKFNPGSLCYRIKAFSLTLLVISLICCKKTANINANKAFINVTHTAYNAGPIILEFDGIPLFTEPLSYGQTTENPNSPYDTTTAGVQYLQVLINDSPIISGNTALQQANNYSLFVYDTLNQKTIHVIVFQDYQGNRTDTFTYIRYLNFTPGSAFGLLVVFPRDTTGVNAKASYRDTINISPSLFVGYNPNPSDYGISTVHIGKNNVFAYVDSARPAGVDSTNFWYMGSYTFDSTKNYNVFLQGYPDTLSGPDTFRLKSIRLN